MKKRFEVLAINVTFLGQTFSKGTCITKESWTIQADAYNKKRAEGTPLVDIDSVFKHMEDRQIIKVYEEKEEETEEIETVLSRKEKKGKREKR